MTQVLKSKDMAQSTFDVNTFFDNFEMFADAPNAVAKMRELILQLAVQGQLGTQNETDEPLRVTLPLNRKNLVPTDLGTFRNQRESLPRGWQLDRLNQLGNFCGGGTPSMKRREYWDGPVLWVSPKDMKRPHITSTEMRITEAALNGTRIRLVPPNSVLIVARSGILKRTLPVSVNDVECTVNQDLKVLILERPETSEFIRILLKGHEQFILTTLIKGGVTVQSLKHEEFENQEFPLPPLAEQKRIVEKVDQLMKLCDEFALQQESRRVARQRLVVASLNRLTSPNSAADSVKHAKYVQDHFDLLFDTPTTIPHLRRTILQLAVQGKLVPQDPNDEPADIAENNTITTRPLMVPSLWRWGLLEQVAESRLGKMLDKAKNVGTSRVYLRNTNVHWMRFDLTSLKEMPFKDEELAEFEVRHGDVLICEGGHGIGRTAVWKGECKQILFQKALHRVRPGKCLDGYYLAFCMRVYDAIGILQTYYTGAGIPHLTGRSLAKLLFPIPPHAEQIRIVAKVAELMSLCDALEFQLQSTATASTNVLNAVVSQLMSSTSHV